VARQKEPLRIGVVAVQGDFPEHVRILGESFATMRVPGEVFNLRTAADAERADGVVIPGGESTTISKLLVRTGAHDVLVRRAREGLPIMGTCAGMILLAEQGDEQVRKTDSKLLGLMHLQVDRNAFGRQRESFETDLELDLPTFGEPVHAVFIRAPAIVRTWGDCRPIARFGDRIVGAEQGSLLGLAFHPELTRDTRVHRYFLEKVHQFASP